MPMEKLARLWPEWKIEKQIGRGTFGSVYQAVRQNGGLTSRAAIKVISIPQSEYELETLRADGMDSQQIRTYLKRIVDDFANEIRVMKNFRGRPNIVSIDEAVVSEKSDGLGWDIFIRMELLTPFTAYISDKKLDEAEVIRLGCDICTALEQCSRRNIIHRDIKPENIFMDSFGSFKLGDFGTARQMEGLTSGFSQKGTFNYMAPEVVNGTGYDARVDLYSLGLVLYRLMNGNRLPFVSKKQLLSPSERRNALDRRIRGDALPPPEEASSSLAQVILHACAYRREDRFENARQMHQALLSCAAGEAPDLPQTREEAPTLLIPQDITLQSEQEPPENPGKKRTLTAWLAALVLLAGSCLGFYYLGGALSQRTDNRELQAVETTVSAETTLAPTEQTLPPTEEARPAGFEPCEVTVLKMPEKQDYTLNEVIDVYGLTLQVTGSDGTEKTVRSGFFYWPKIVTETGITQVQVVYQGMETSFPIHVAERSGVLSVETMPDKQVYQMGESLDTQGLSLRVRRADGTEEIITEGFTCSPERITGSGYQTVTVTYEGMITRFMVSSYYSGDYYDWDAYYQEVEDSMSDFTFENVKLEPFLNYHESSGTGLNQDGTPVTWMARITFDMSQDQFLVLENNEELSVRFSWEGYPSSIFHPIGGSFTSAKLGVSAVSYTEIPASESESGRHQYAFDIQLPDAPHIAGDRWIKFTAGEQEIVIRFHLEYLGDYETGLGWEITDIEYEA